MSEHLFRTLLQTLFTEHCVLSTQRPVAVRLGCTMGQLALAWCIANPDRGCVVWPGQFVRRGIRARRVRILCRIHDILGGNRAGHTAHYLPDVSTVITGATEVGQARSAAHASWTVVHMALHAIACTHGSQGAQCCVRMYRVRNIPHVVPHEQGCMRNTERENTAREVSRMRGRVSSTACAG